MDANDEHSSDISHETPHGAIRLYTLLSAHYSHTILSSPHWPPRDRAGGALRAIPERFVCDLVPDLVHAQWRNYGDGQHAAWPLCSERGSILSLKLSIRLLRTRGIPNKSVNKTRIFEP